MRKAEAAGIITPLEGKTPEQKEKILRAQAAMGLPLPEGRTASEKALIEKVKATKKRSLKTALLTPLTGKTPEEKEKILRGRAMKGLPLPEAASASEKKLIDKVRVDLGLPKEPTTKSMKEKHEKAAKAGFLQPLEGKTPEEKEKTLKALQDLGIPLPEGRTPSEKALIAKVKTAPPSVPAPSEQMRKAKAEGLLTPLAGKTPEQKEKILKGLAMRGLPLPEAASASEKKLIDKVRVDLGLPKEPETKSMKAKYEQAAKAGLLQPLEGKTPEEKEKTLRGLQDLGIPLPEGRTPSEKALIAKVKTTPPSVPAPSEQMRKAKAEGLLTPLAGKTPEQKEKILKGLAMRGLPLPEAASASEKKLIDKVRVDLGLPKEPETKSMKAKYEQAAKAGLLQPLEGKTPEEKEKTLRGLQDMGIPLPEGRTPSEKALIAKVKTTPPSVPAPSEQMRKAKAEGLLTPLAGKTPEQKEKILKGLAMRGLPLPEAASASEKKLIDKVRVDLGLPKEPETKSMKAKYEQAAKAGLLEPLEGKTPAQKEAQLKGLRDMGIPLPEGRTPSEKALIAKVKGAPRSMVAPSEQMRRAKAEGLITPLTGKTPAQKEKILKGLAMKGIPLPEGKSPSEKQLIDKVRNDLGLPKEPDTKSMKSKYDKAAKAGFLQPLVGKTPEEKEKILQGQHDLGIPLPEGRTPSEKALIAKVKASPPAGSIKTAGLMTPLAGKPPAQKEKLLRARAMKGIPLPEGATASEKKLIDKVRADLGLPKEPDTKSMKVKHEQAAKAGLLEPLEGKTPAQKEAQLKGLRDMGIPLPEGRTPSEKALIDKVKAAPKSLVAPSEQMRRAKAEGLMTPLTGKTPAQKEKILKGLAMKGIPLPEGKSPSEKQLIDKVRNDLGLPKGPDTKSMKSKYDKAAKAGFLQPLVGKTPEEKEKILQGQHDLGIPLPEGRTPSEKALIAKVKASPPAGSIKTAGLMTPLAGKPPAQQEKVLRARAMKGIPLPEGATPSEKKIIDKVRADLGLPKEPDTKSMKAKHEQAAKAGLLEPLEGKTPAQKEAQLKGLRDMGIPLPEGRTPSEKALIAKVKGAPRSMVAPSEQMRRAKAEGLITPLTGKTPAQKEKILKGLAMKGIPLPEGKSPSEKQLIDKVRNDLGLPKEPDTKSMKSKYDKAAKAGFLQPLVGKTPEEKEKILQGQHDLGIPLPEGRTPSEKALIAKVKASPPAGSIKTAGLMTPLAGKPPAQQEKVLRARAMKGIPLPEGATPSEKKVIDKVRADLGLPKEPDTKSMKAKHEQAAKAGLLEPLEGKTPAQKEAQLKGLRDMGIPLPEGRTPSEKALIAKVKGAARSMVAPSEQMRRAKAEGLLTPLTGKTPAQKEKILKGLAMKGIPLPESTSPSEKHLIDKVRNDLGLPKEPDTKSMKSKYDKAAKAGFLQPLVGKTPEEKEKILQGQHDLGIPLPEGRTPSEKALIAKVKASPPAGSIKTAGLMTPLAGKTPAQQEKVLRARAMKGIPLPEGATPSEKKVIDKVRADLGLPKEPDTKSMKAKHEQAAKAGLLEPLEGKTPAQKEAQLKGLRDMGIPLPEGRTPSEKALIAKVKAAPRSMVAPSEQMRRAKAEGLITPLTGKTPAQKEKILRGLAMKGIPLPESTSPSEKQLIDKVRNDLGLPKEPDTKSMKSKYDKAAKAGFLQPLVGKTPEEKEKILQGQHDLGIPLPEGRTPSEKALIAKVKASAPAGSIKTAGLMTPLAGKTPAQQEKVLRARAMKGIPLPEGATPSEKKVIDKVRADLGLPKEPDTKSMKAKHEQAAKAGLLEPLEGKTPAQKEAQLKGLRDMGIPLPEGRTPSEKALIDKVKAAPKSLVALSEQMRRAKAEGLMTPLTGKTPAQKEKILKGLAMKGIPLPEGKSPSEKQLIDKVRVDLGLPKEPDTKSMKAKHEQAAKAGLLEPLEGKTPAQKEAQLKGLRDMGIPLPEGRTPSEKALIDKVKAAPKSLVAPSERMRRAKAEGLMTPLTGKTPAQKEEILKGLAMKGIPLPEGKSPSEKQLIDKVRVDLGLPKEPDTKSMKAKHEQAAKAGLLEPLEGKTPAQKEAQLKGLRDMGIPLPEGRTPSEKALIDKVKAAPKSLVAPSERMRRAKAEGLMTPLTGKTPAQKEEILKGLAMKGIPLPEGKSPSEKQLIDKVRVDLGLPKEPDTKSMKAKHEQAAKAGLLEPLEGKTPAQKEAQLKGLRDMGIPLPEGRTPSEKALIDKVKAAPKSLVAPSEQMRRAKAEGLMTPLTGKTPAQKEKILKGLAMKGLPLPEGKSPSEKQLIDKVRDDLGLPKEPDTKSMKEKHEQAAKAGFLQPLVGKTPEEKEKILQGQHDLGIPLPEGRTPSEKALIDKIKASPPAGLMTPLAGKTPAQKEKVLRAQAMKGIPLPEGATPSEKKVIDKVRADLGLPKEPDTKSMKAKHEQAAKAGLLEPLEGKTPAQKEAQLKGLRDMGIPLPEGRTPSEKALIDKVKAAPKSLVAPSEQMRRAKAEGLMTPLTGKTPAQKEKILKGLAMKGIPLPEGKSPSEKQLIDKVRDDLGLPKEPDTKSMRDKHEQAAKAGFLQPLVGKTPEEKEKILQGQHDLGIPLPEGRTPSEKALIAKIKASPPAGSIKIAGLMTPLAGKTPAQQEKVLRARAMKGIPLPEGATPSEKKVIDKVRADLGLPKEPDTLSMKAKHEQAAKAGLLEPLEGKTPAQKEAQLKGLRDMGIPLPEGRTPSEKALIDKVKAAPKSLVAPSEQIRRAKAEGLMTPLTGKTPAQKEKILKGLAMKGLPLPEGKSPSEKQLIDKVRDDLGLPKEPDTKSMKEKHEQAAKAGFLQPLVGKTPEEKEKILQGQHDLGIPLPEGRTPSEKALIDKIKASPPAGLMTPLAGKTPAQKEKVLRARAMKGIPLPEGATPSEKKVIDKVRADLGLPKEPDTKSMKAKHEQAAKAGLLEPLEGKTPAQKEAQLKGLRDMGIPLPEGRTPSEKALIDKVKAAPKSLVAPSEQMRRAKAEGLMTPLTGKTPAQKEKILKGLAMKGLPLPEGKSPSEKQLIDKVRDDLGLPKEPDTKSMKEKHEQAAKAGFLQPLVGKTPEEKEKILQGQHDLGIPLPEGRTPSEKALIDKIKASPPAGLMTPLAGKTPAQKEKVLRAQAMKGIPLPEGATPSEKKVIDKVRADLGLPKEPDTKSMKAKHEQAAKAGLLEPLEGKTPAQKEAQLKGLRDMGIPLPEGRTPSEKALIDKVKAAPKSLVAPSEQMRRAKAEGLMTPLTGKTPAQKEKILKGLAMKGIPLPEGTSPSEKQLIDKVREDLGLPKEPDTKSMKAKHEQAAKAGLLQPLVGKTPEEKEKILQGQHDLGIPLPEGRTPSEKALIAKVKASTKKAESVPTITTEKLKQAKAAGLLTPLAGKTPEEKEKILQGLAQTGLPLPEGKTPSEKALINKVKKGLGISDRTPSERVRRAKAAGLLTPLEGKTPAQKEKILRGRAAAGLPLPMAKTPSERALINKIKEETGYVTPSPSVRLQKAKDAGLLTPLKGKSPSMKLKILQGMKAAGVPIPEGETPSEKKLISKFISKSKVDLERIPSDKIRAAKAAGLLTPLEGKTPAEKEKILKGLAEAGLPLPEGKTKSEKSMIAKIKARTPPEGKTPSEKSIIGKAKAAGLFTPITGKAPAEKERILKGLADAGLPLPEGKTASEKELVKKIRAEAGLTPEPTPSEKKGKIRKKEKKVGVSASKKAAGIAAESFQDIIKTTKCDRGCGCDRKKIKFKHSYVKIRVTSPDISSFCDCPDECFPGVKNGAFIDNDGIKVTVGSAVGIPSYSMVCFNQETPDKMALNTDICETKTSYYNNVNVLNNSKYKFNINSNKANDNLNVSSSDISYRTKIYSSHSENDYVHSSSIAHYKSRTSKSEKIVENIKDLQLLEDIYKQPTSKTKSASSFDTILIIRNDMSLSTSTSNSMDTVSLTSVMGSSISSSSAHYSGYQSTNDLLSINSLDGPITSEEYIDHPAVRECKALEYIEEANSQRYTIRITRKRFAATSSVFLMVPTSEDEGSSTSDSMTSMLSTE
ncbi:hypothetical protein PYW07_000108 [Mythimna separata]|uniref:Uncharacterized protein n=1 Tax=Mythimna separata TaxID=271217 RepID=A0AAD7Z2E6_MYTSE|nr:hypothetical protein PYW07_000108 [Mythimna separata]